MKKIILSILALVLLVIALIVFWTMRSFNAENYKNQVVKTLETLTGRTVTVAGEVSLAWTPLPTFMMNQLSLSNDEKSKIPQMLSVEQVQVEIEWSSFFKNPLKIKRIVLKKPNLLIERQYSYQTNFFFPILFNPNRSNDQDSLLASSSVAATSIENLEIDSGTLTWQNNLTSEKIVFQNINGKGKMTSLDGPYFFEGNFQLLNQPFNLNLKTDKLLIASPLQITLDLDNSETQTNFKMAATLNFEEKEDQWLNIEGAYSSQKPSLFFQKFGINGWNSQGSLAGSYKIEVQPKLTQIKDIIFSQKHEEETILSAKLSLTQAKEGKKLLSLIADVVDLKQFNPQVLTYLSQNSMDLDIQILKALWGKIVLAPLSLKGTTDKGILSAQLSATIPNADKTVNGAVSFNGSYHLLQKHLEGKISANLSDALAWAYDVFDKKYLPQSGTKNFHIEETVDMTPENQTTEIQVGTLDDIQFTGKIIHTLENWRTDLNIKKLNLDNYYTLPNDFFDQLYQQILGSSSTPFVAGKTPTIWNIEISDMIFNRLAFPLVRLAGTLEKDKVSLSDITLKVSEDNSLSLSGTVNQMGTPDVSFDKATLHFVSDNLKKWSFLGKVLDFFVQKDLTSLNTFLIYTGNLQQGNLQLSLSSKGYELSTEGEVKNLFKTPEFYANKVHFVCPNLSKMMKLMNTQTDFFETMPISLDFNGILTKSLDSLSCSSGNLKLGKDKAEISGKYDQKENHLSLDVQSDNLNLNLFWEALKKYWENPEQLWITPVPADFSMDFLIQTKQLEVHEVPYKNLKIQGNLLNQQMELKEFSFEEKNKKATFNMVGSISLNENAMIDGHIKMNQMALPEGLFSWDDYSLGQGSFTVETDLKANGNNMKSLWNSCQFSTPFEWTGAVFSGVNLAALKKTTLTTLEMTEVPTDFTTRLDHDFQNGHTPLPSLTGKLKMEQGQLSFLNVQGANDLLDVSGLELKLSDLAQQAELKIPFILKMTPALPAIIFELSDTKIKIEHGNFVGALTDTVKLLSSQNFEKKQQKLKKEKEQKSAKMQQSAEQILSQTQTLLKVMQEKVSLNPSPQANEKMAQLTKGVEEIRRIAVKPNLTEGEYTSLLGKTKMLSAQAKDFNNWFSVSDFMNRKKMTLQQAQESDKLLNQMEKIYQQNSRSVLMAEIIVNARSVVQNIHDEAERLQNTKEKEEILQLMNQIDEDRLKLQKAHDFMEKQNTASKE